MYVIFSFGLQVFFLYNSHYKKKSFCFHNMTMDFWCWKFLFFLREDILFVGCITIEGGRIGYCCRSAEVAYGYVCAFHRKRSPPGNTTRSSVIWYQVDLIRKIWGMVRPILGKPSSRVSGMCWGRSRRRLWYISPLSSYLPSTNLISEI